MKKSAHQVWKEAKEMHLDEETFKKYLKDNGVTASKESIDRQMEIAANILTKMKPNS